MGKVRRGNLRGEEEREREMVFICQGQLSAARLRCDGVRLITTGRLGPRRGVQLGSRELSALQSDLQSAAISQVNS